MTKNDDVTTIRVELPLPLDVASNLMNVLGTIYPNARVRPFDGSHMTIEVDLADRVLEPFRSFDTKRVLAGAAGTGTV